MKESQFPKSPNSVALLLSLIILLLGSSSPKLTVNPSYQKNNTKPVSLLYNDKFSIDIEDIVDFSQVSGQVAITSNMGEAFTVDDVYSYNFFPDGEFKVMNQIKNVKDDLFVTFLDNHKMIVHKMSHNGRTLLDFKIVNFTNKTNSTLSCTDAVANPYMDYIHVGCYENDIDNGSGSISIYTYDYKMNKIISMTFDSYDEGLKIENRLRMFIANPTGSNPQLFVYD